MIPRLAHVVMLEPRWEAARALLAWLEGLPGRA
jgi:hypothetical protein